MNKLYPPGKLASGFTLIELLMVVAIIGIITAIALPSYQESVLRTNRADGKAALMRAAALQETTYSATNLYTADAVGILSIDGNYLVTVVTAVGNNSFVATATAQGNQVNDVCGNLTLSSVGLKGSSGGNAQTCWQR